MKGKFQIGHLINPKLHDQVVRCQISGDKLHFTLESNVTVFFKDVTLEVVNVYVSNDKNMDDLLICINPDVGKHEWFQIKTKSAKMSPISQKEPKMIDLISAKAGDKFVLRGGQITTLINKNKVQIVLECEIGFYLNSAFSGVSTEDEEFDIISKHDPRPWLKHLPDADLFSSTITHVCFNDEQGWLYTMNNGKTWHQINVIKMPTLTGDQWKDSKISIVDLREWQKTNKS